MSFIFKPGQFTLNTTTGQQVIDTGTAVEGKAVICWTTGRTSNGTGGGIDSASLGAAVSATKRGCISWGMEDALAATNAASDINARLLRGHHGGGASRYIVDFVSFGTAGDAGKFTINVVNQAGANPHIINYIFIGGSDVAADLVQYAAKTGSTGNRDDTGASLGGDGVPDAALSFGAAKTALNSVQIHASNWIGFAGSSTKRWAMAWGEADNVSAGNVKHYHSNAKCIAGLGTNGTALDYLADHVAFINGGQTLNWTDFAGQASIYFSLYFKGGSWDAGNFAAPTGGGTPQSQEIPTEAAVEGVAFASACQATAMDTLGDEHGFMFGAGRNLGSVEEIVAVTKGENVINTDENAGQSATKCISILNPTVVAEADYSTQDSDSFAISWTTIDASNAHKIFWFGVGPTAAGGGGDQVEFFKRRR